MKTFTKIVIAILVLKITIIGLAAVYLPLYDVDVRQSNHEAYVGEITGDMIVGQTFKANEDNLASVSVYLSPFSAYDAAVPVNFHLRQFVDSVEDIYVGEVLSSALEEGEFYRFEFEPIENSGMKEYFFFISSPTAVSGSAVTVGAANNNVYEEGQAYIKRGREDIRFYPQPETDLAFKTHYYAPLRIVVLNYIKKGLTYFVSTWHDNLSLYISWTKIVIPAILLLWILMALRRTRYDKMIENHGEGKVVGLFLFFLFMAAVVMRLLYAFELPVTSDEGRYLYDAKLLREGVLAGGDGYVKAPLVIGWIALWQYLLAEDTLFAGRLSSVLISALTIFPLYFIAKYLWDKRVALVAAALWSLTGVAILYGIYVHTQPLAIFLSVLSIAFLCTALRRDADKKQIHLIVIAGICMALALLSRKSVLALMLLPLVLILIEAKAWRRLSYLVAFAAGGLIVLLPFLWAVDSVYGDHGVWEAVGIYAANDAWRIVQSVSDTRWYADSVGSILPLFRQAFPVLLLFLIGLGISGEKFIRSAIKFVIESVSWQANTLVDHVLPKILWIFPIFIFAVVWTFWLENETALYTVLGMEFLWPISLALLGVYAIWPRPKEEKITKEKSATIVPYSTQPNVIVPYPHKKPSTETMAIKPLLTPTLLVPVWLLGLMVLYASWIKFNTDYLAEFIPVFILLAAFGGAYAFDRLRRSPWLAKKYPGVGFLRFIIFLPVASLLLWSFTVSGYATFMFDHTGEYTQEALFEAAAWAKDNIPDNEYIFTGLPIVPYLSGHRTALDIAHSGWYAYDHTRSDSVRLNAFLPPISDLLNSFEQAQWVLAEKQTRLHFIEPYAAIRNGLENNFTVVKEIDSQGTPILFYKRQ